MNIPQLPIVSFDLNRVIEIRTCLPIVLFDKNVPSNTQEIIVEMWGAGGDGNVHGGGDGGDYLFKRFIGKNFALVSAMISTSGFNTTLDLTVDGKAFGLEVACGKEKKNQAASVTPVYDSGIPQTWYDVYLKGAHGDPNTLTSIATIDPVNLHVVELGGNGGTSYNPINTGGKGTVYTAQLVKPQSGVWTEKNVISYIHPADGLTPGGGGGGGSKYYSQNLPKNLFGHGGGGMIRLTFLK